MEMKDNELDKSFGPNLVAQIEKLQQVIDEKKEELFLHRLGKITKCEFRTGDKYNIAYERISSSWSISYDFETDKYDVNDYNYNSDSETEIAVKKKRCRITFGKNSNRYFIKGNGIRSNRFKIYRNSRGLLRIINHDYNAEIDLTEQKDLLMGYGSNKDLPEWLAVRVFMYIFTHEWSDDSIEAFFEYT